MRNFYLLFTFLFVISFGKAQVIFSEDFQGGIPATWTLIDNDGNTPDPNVAQ